MEHWHCKAMGAHLACDARPMLDLLLVERGDLLPVLRETRNRNQSIDTQSTHKTDHDAKGFAGPYLGCLRPVSLAKTSIGTVRSARFRWYLGLRAGPSNTGATAF